MTFRAALGIGENPIGRLGFVAAFFVPQFQMFATGGGVGFLTANETKRHGAGIAVCDTSLRFHGGRRHGAGHTFATGARAPPRERIAFHKGAQLKGSEFLEYLGGFPQCLCHFVFRDDLFARRFRTGFDHTGRSFIDGVDAKVLPAIETKGVTARHGQHFIDVVKANTTHFLRSRSVIWRWLLVTASTKYA